MNSYNDILNRISQFKRFGNKKPNLFLMEKLMEKLNNPQEKLKIIHVAGTNGKGSVCGFIANGLKKNNKKVGLFTSPYIHVFNERIKINNENIPDEKLISISKIVFEKSKEVFNENGEEPKQFEIITAIAFLYFYNENCDYVVLEVGLGGRFDATNIIKTPILSVITKISLDHTEILGKTEEEIAFEKAGIIKNNIPVFYYNDYSNVIKNIACEKKSSIKTFSNINNLCPDNKGTDFIFENKAYRINMLGQHQVYNSALAIMTLEYLNVEYEKIVDALKEFSFDGRFYKVSKKPLVFVDGAHNIDGAKSILETIEFHQMKNPYLIISMGKEKDYINTMKIFSKINNIILTSFVNSIEPFNLKKYTFSNNNVEIIEELIEIKNYMMKNPNNTYIFCGSLYKVSEVINFFRQN